MIRATPSLRTAAERLLGLEARAREDRAATLPAAARVAERLRRVLAPLLGAAGFRALVVRAVALAKREVPELSGVVDEADGSLSGLGVDQLDNDTLADGEVVVVAHILGLLVTFVGVALMLRLVSDAWPKASLNEIDFDEG